MITCYISLQREEIVLSLKNDDEITLLKQSTGRLEKPLDILFYNSGRLFIDCSDNNSSVKKESFSDYHILARSDIALSLTRYCNSNKAIEGEELSVISQTESAYDVVHLGNVMNSIFNDISETLSEANVAPDEFVLPISLDSTLKLYYFIEEWWSKSPLREKKLNFIYLERALAMGLMRGLNVHPPVVVVDYDYMNAKLVCLTYDDTCYCEQNTEYLEITLIDLYDELIQAWKEEYALEIKKDLKTTLTLYHICNSVFSTLVQYSQAEVNLTFIQDNLRPLVPKQKVVNLLKEKVIEVSQQIDRFVSTYPGCKVIVTGGTYNMFTIFNSFFPHLSEWTFATHEDTKGWDVIPMFTFELTTVLSFRNQSMKLKKNRLQSIDDSFVSLASVRDSACSQISSGLSVDESPS